MSRARSRLRAGFAVPAAVAAALLACFPVAAAGGGPGEAVPGAPAPAPASALPSAPDTVPGDPLRPIALDAVAVTVLRTPVSRRASPFAVAVLGEDELQAGRSGAFLEEAVRGLPGVHVQNRYNFAVGERVTMRGFGGRAQFGIRGIRVLVDGIPATLPDGQSTLDHLDVGSLGRVEAVRGPSSALFGNASGGVLSFHTRTPGPAPLRLEVEQVGGSHGLARTQATASGTVEGTGYFLNLSTQRWDGYRTNPDRELLDRDTYGRADRLGLNARVTRPVGDGELSLTVNVLDLESENPGSLGRDLMDDPDRPAHGAGGFSNVARRTGKDLRQGLAGLRWEGPVGGLDGEVAVFGVRRSMVNPIPPTIIDLDRDGGGLRAQLSGARETGLGALRWHAGVESELMFDDRLNFLNDAGERGDRTLDQRERVRTAGLFLQANVPLPAGAEGLAGLRYDRHDFRAWDRFPREGDDPSATGERAMDALSPSLGANVPLGERVNLFGSVGTVFETPSTTELGNRPDGAGGFNPELEPQTGTSGELGLRGDLAAFAVFEVTAYRTNLRNELVRFQVEAFPGRDFFRNAGTSRHTGVEATLSMASTGGGLRGDVTYTRTNARFRSFEWDGEEMGGNRIPGIAPGRLNGTLAVNPPGWFGELSGTWVDRVLVDDANTEFAPSHFLLDLRAGSRGLPLGQLQVAPWAAVTNVLDRHHTTSVVPNAAGDRFYEPGPGRSLQLGLRASWGGGG